MSSAFPIKLKTRYLRAILEGGLSRDASLRLTQDEKKDLARKMLLLANPPHQPFPRSLEQLIDSDLMLAYPWMTETQKRIFDHVQETVTYTR